MNITAAQYYKSVVDSKTSPETTGVDSTEAHALVDLYRSKDFSEENPNVQLLGGPSLAKVKIVQQEKSLHAWLLAEQAGREIARAYILQNPDVLADI